MTQENAKQEYVLPQDVDYTKPFKFVTGIDGGIVYSIDNFRKGRVEVTWEGAHTDYSSDSIKGHIQYEDWLVLKEPTEDLFGTQFQFKCGSFPYVYLYSNQRYKIVGEDRWYGIDENVARKSVASGCWTVLPSKPKQLTSTPKQFDEEAFSKAEKAVKRALFPVVEPSLQEVLSEFHQNFCGQLEATWRNRESTYYTLKFGMFGDETLKKVLMAINGVKID